MVGSPQPVDVSVLFFKQAARHFVCMSYWAAIPSVAAPTQHFASCFVIECDGQWFLISAGHVINGLRDAIKAGATISHCFLQDRFASGRFEHALPYLFDADQWVTIEGDPSGTDYAAAPLSDFFVDGLKAGGIQPIEERAWGLDPAEDYPTWILVGVPDESREVINGRTTIKLTLMPLEACSPPTATAQPVITEGRHFARLVKRPGDKADVNDIEGMSGGPIFGVRADGSIRYWVIGIQSGWFQGPRIVAFCPIAIFFLSLKEALRQFRERAAGA